MALSHAAILPDTEVKSADQAHAEVDAATKAEAADKASAQTKSDDSSKPMDKSKSDDKSDSDYNGRYMPYPGYDRPYYYPNSGYYPGYPYGSRGYYPYGYNYGMCPWDPYFGYPRWSNPWMNRPYPFYRPMNHFRRSFFPWF